MTYGKHSFCWIPGCLGSYSITFLFYLLVTWVFLIHQIFFGESLSPRQPFSGGRPSGDLLNTQNWSRQGLLKAQILDHWFVMGQWMLQSDLKALHVEREPHLLREKFLQPSPACDRVSNNPTSTGRCYCFLVILFFVLVHNEMWPYMFEPMQSYVATYQHLVC